VSVSDFFRPFAQQCRQHRMPMTVFFLQAQGESLCPCFFQCLEATHIPWLAALLLASLKQKYPVSITLLPLSVSLSLSDSSWKDSPF
jgi:hypothetical protein